MRLDIVADYWFIYILKPMICRNIIVKDRREVSCKSGTFVIIRISLGETIDNILTSQERARQT